jgi:tetratricopeptide (TPR) repeat protein
MPLPGLLPALAAVAPLPVLPAPPQAWAGVPVVAAPFLPAVGPFAPRPHASGVVTAETRYAVRVDWGTGEGWVPKAAVLTQEQALTLAASRLGRSPLAAVLHKAAADAAWARNDDPAAVRALDRAEAAAPGWPAVRYCRAAVRDRMKDYGAAARDAAAYRDAAPDREDAHALLVTVLVHARRLDDARRAADAAAAAFPADPGIAALPAWVAAESGFALAAVEKANALAARFPDHPVALFARGHAHLEAGSEDRAAADLGAALDLCPDLRPKVSELGGRYADDGRHRDAAAVCLSAVIDRFPDAHPERFARGRVRFDQGRYADAEADLTRLVAEAPGIADGWAVRAFCRLNLQRFEEAMADLRRVAELAPRHPLLAHAVREMPRMLAAVRPPEPGRVSALAASAAAVAEAAFAADPPRTADDCQVLVVTYTAAGRPEEAAAWRRRAEAVGR